MEGALRRIAAAHPGQTVAVFTHGTVIRQVLSHILALPPEQWGGTSHSENTAVTCLDFDGTRFSIRFRDDASHLPPELGTMSKQKWWRGSSAAKDVNLWYRPIDWGREQGLYLEARREAWGSIHGARAPFQPEGFLEAARLHLSRTPWGVTAAMAGDSLAGFLQLDPERYREEGAGYIPFCYLRPEFRAQHLGIDHGQLPAQLFGRGLTEQVPIGGAQELHGAGAGDAVAPHGAGAGAAHRVCQGGHGAAVDRSVGRDGAEQQGRYRRPVMRK